MNKLSFHTTFKMLFNSSHTFKKPRYDNKQIPKNDENRKINTTKQKMSC